MEKRRKKVANDRTKEKPFRADWGEEIECSLFCKLARSIPTGKLVPRVFHLPALWYPTGVDRAAGHLYVLRKHVKNIILTIQKFFESN